MFTMEAWVGFMRLLVGFRVVVLRRDEAIWSWRSWLREDPLVRPYRWLRPDLVPPVSCFAV